MRRRSIILAGAIATAVVAAAVMASPLVRPQCTTLNGGDTLVIRGSSLVRGAVRFFCYRDRAGERLRFILARDSDGGIHAVFDACRQCYKFHKGYSVSGGYLVCRLCGNRYALKEMQAGKASCVPVKLPLAQRGDAVEVKIADLKGGRSLF
jgi:uncharacterized membrane protein